MNEEPLIEDCLFCKFAQDLSKVGVIMENEDFFVINDKFPKAPVHLLVIPKSHVSKKDLQEGRGTDFYTKILKYVHEVAKEQGFMDRGYEIRANFSGYNHIDHEHVHIMHGHQ